MNEWFYVKDGKQSGPVSDTELDQLLSDRSITSETQIWKEGMADWISAGKRAEVKETVTTSEKATALIPLPGLVTYQSLSILACVVCLVNPFAAFAFVFSLQAKNAHSDGRIEDAHRKLKLCKRMLIIAFILSALVYTGVILFMNGMIPIA